MTPEILEAMRSISLSRYMTIQANDSAIRKGWQKYIDRMRVEIASVIQDLQKLRVKLYFILKNGRSVMTRN